MAEAPPSAVRAILSASRDLANALGRLVEDPKLMESVRRDLGLPPASEAATSAAVNTKLTELDTSLKGLESQPGDELVFDERTAELLLGGKRFVELLEVMLPGKDPADPRTYGDITYALATIFGSEWFLRPRAPWLYGIVRFLMLGYERIEDVPKFDPFHIFDRMTGDATRTREAGFGATEALGGIAIPAVIILLNWLISKRTDEQHLHDKGFHKGDLYFVGELDFKLGWEAVPDVSPEMLALLTRAISIGFTGKIKAFEMPHEGGLTALLTMMALEEQDGGPGFLMRLGGAGEFKFETASSKGGAIKTELEVKLAGGPGMDFLWNTRDDTFRYLGSSASNPLIEVAVETKGTEDVPALRIGKAGKSRFDLVGLKSGLVADPHDPHGFLEFSNCSFVLDLAEVLPGPVGKVFKSAGAGLFTGKIDGKLKFGKTFAFEGEAGLKVRLASNAVNVGALRFDYLDLEVAAGTEGGFSVGLLMAAHFELGPFAATVDQMGFAIEWKNEGGQLKEHFKFKPPKGIGARISLPTASGGGFLLLDYDKGEFAGAFELRVFDSFAIQAIVILTTKVPEGKAPFALFISGNIRFPGGIEVGLGFKINALGLLLGLHHGFDCPALLKALPSGAMDDVLFPKDIVGDAPRIINSLRTIFPIEANALTIGFMIELGWGSDYICSLRLGLIFPFDNALGGDRCMSLDSIVLLGRAEVVCFKDLPKPIRIQIICDFVAEVRFCPFAITLLAQLRDSRIGTIAIEGSIAASLVTGSDARFILAAGGFHPEYKNVPADFPAPLARLAMTYDIGVIKAWMRAYFAIAPGSIQFGAELGIRYKLGPISFQAEFGLDVLIQLPPDFYFQGKARGSAAVKFRGHNLLGVSLELLLCGPRRWRAKGKGTFSILFWDVDIEFDESWGNEDALERQRTNVAALVHEDLNNATHWRLELPRGTSTLVTLAGQIPADESVMTGHPLSVLSFTQNRVPFGLELHRYGTAEIDGLKLFPVPKLTNELDQSLGSANVLSEQFPVSEFLNIAEEDRLSRPGFQAMAAGIATSSGGYAVPPSAPLDSQLVYEEIFRDEPSSGSVLMYGLDLVTLGKLVAIEAAGRSEARWKDKLAVKTAPVETRPSPKWVAADATLLTAATVAAAPDWAATSPAYLASMHAASKDRVLIVEEYELES